MPASVSFGVRPVVFALGAALFVVPRVSHAQVTDVAGSAPVSSSAASTTAAEALDARADYLHASSDRVEVRLESSGLRERVGVSATTAGGALGSGRGLGDEELHWMLCETPCSIWVRPGVAHLVVRGVEVASFVTDQPVLPAQPLRVRLRARARSLGSMETAFSVTGLVLGLYGGIFTALTFPNLQTSNPTLPIIGITSLGIAAGFLVSALIVHVESPVGIAVSEPLAPTVVGDWRPLRPGALPVWVSARSM